ncbi:ABC transporter ATP-binding protein [Alkalisalibacterium limincola]|uniref:ABC transporter ATP-binding protein n=1 Tax=Alkalisalibacterium limincola TaxID=2699169 RepID=A0A5C8KW04_9GAMM|nr:ABC transporter ATP-binding protein [Alkalisalibacterium limincola]TXK65989.1 ABC transporter ATP-binding protein [Alkalisalibacterium limincola]
MDVKVSGLTKRYGGQAVFDRLALDVAEGEFVALVGRSGAGKSTLLHLLSGIDAPDAGRVQLGDTDITALDEPSRTAFRRRHLGLVFQAYNLVPSLSAIDNVRLPMELVGMSPAQARSDAQATLEALGLAALAQRFPEQLSGGEQQRIGVARALAHSPGLVLADEPTGSLDLDNAVAVIDLLAAACRQRGATLLLVTHSQDVMDRADRLLRLVEGRLVPG